jgi:hypothetical protein
MKDIFTILAASAAAAYAGYKLEDWQKAQKFKEWPESLRPVAEYLESLRQGKPGLEILPASNESWDEMANVLAKKKWAAEVPFLTEPLLLALQDSANGAAAYLGADLQHMVDEIGDYTIEEVCFEYNPILQFNRCGGTMEILFTQYM